ncbi:hypothetical protein OOK58_09945 [Streptomyces sp. NBC_01728]|uniref:hypothetical protein n=1 Tax=Streptomyces sp. NBC_01719 TaxID=2975920 RepID=UPI0022562756|nr:hypothetical protein [Streptomyces sp. NBC_01719]MCX4452424.1 hypothetical protein [Streptomyces sp. NBC_01719]MCX4491784.1 hypothetical protein [Streptomyces sp. NBC_01728]
MSSPGITVRTRAPIHSAISFTIRHHRIADLRERFSKFTAGLDTEEAPADVQVPAERAPSLTTPT